MMLLTKDKASSQVVTSGPLHDHLSAVVMPQIDNEVKDPEFIVSCLGAFETVYLFQERKTNQCVVGKFFGRRNCLSNKEKQDSLNNEYNNLCLVREKGFSNIPERVVRPFSKDEKINYLLVEEFIRGHNLDYYFCKAAFQGQGERLVKKIKKLAQFIFNLHDKTSHADQVNFDEAIRYFSLIIDTLLRDGILSSAAVGEFYHMLEAWQRSEDMWQNISVLVHGDATPTNFFFHPEDGVTAIDLERMHPADRAYDIGFLAAELKHHFAWRLLNSSAAEPFVSHLYGTYCEGFPDPEKAFHEITQRARFYMALGEMRIARNPWLPLKHRLWLIEEALRCLSV